MRFIFADSLDMIDPAFDFAADRMSADREQYWGDVYPHEYFPKLPYDGVLVSRGVVGDDRFPGKYPADLMMRFRRVGARAFLRLNHRRFAHMSIFGDCGAFSYAHLQQPPYTPAEMLEFYADGRFTHGCSVDHIIFDFDENARALKGGNEDARWRFDVTLENAAKFLKLSRGLPRGSSRERVRVNAKEYRLSGDDARVLATVGAFRVVPAGDLRDPNPNTPTRPARDLERLRDLGLVQTTPYVLGRTRTTLVTLTSEGRALLEQSRRPGGTSPRQAFYVGISKPRELAHDSRVCSAYMRAAERLVERGERLRRVVLEEELKREYQRFLQAENRERRERGEPPERRSEAVALWAKEHELPCDDGHVQLPDARLEYEDHDGRRAVEDIEVVTPHYRGAHAAAKVRAGFTRYRAVGARLGGLRTTGRSGRGVNPRLAEELLS